MSRRLHVPWYIWVILGIWVLQMVGVWWLRQNYGWPSTVCTLRAQFGIPCAACGGTRSALFLTQGKLFSALRMNPLATSALLGFGGWLIMRFGMARALVFHQSTKRIAVLVILLLGLLLLNWVYVILTQTSS